MVNAEGIVPAREAPQARRGVPDVFRGNQDERSEDWSFDSLRSLKTFDVKGARHERAFGSPDTRRRRVEW